jgi:citrate lyase beta subunit
MPDSDVNEKIREMLKEMGDDRLLAHFEDAVAAFDERDRAISNTLDGLLRDVDELLIRVDAIEAADEAESSEIERNELC